MNPLMVAFLPILALLLARPGWAYKPWVPWAVFAVLMVYGVLRNVPVWPFTWLAPG
ncbi:MAG: hypothetical protein JXB04_04540 [Kiritimatiellae bacterium]|nr:hypothetical protein [Kiritimatiellia bacterium]